MGLRPLGLFAILCTVNLFAAAPALAVSITLTPTFDRPGAKVAVNGAGFDPYAAIDVYFDGTDELVVTAGAAGKFGKRSFHIPAGASPGEHWVSAVQRKDGKGAQKRFLVSVSWAEFGYDRRNNRINPYETILSPNSVDRLGKLWATVTIGGIQASPAIVDGIIYIGSGNQLYAMSTETGAVLWTAALNSTANPQSSAAVANGVVYVGSTDGNMYAFDAKTGAAIWVSKTGGGIHSSPAIANGMVYFGSEDKNVYAVDARTGALIWTSPTNNEVFASPAVSGGKVYIGALGGTFYALDANTGALVWTTGFNQGDFFSSAAVVDGVVYVGDAGLAYSVYAIDAVTGATLWSTFVQGPVISSPAVANGIVYVGSDHRLVHALDARTGNEVWAVQMGDDIWSSPAVANGVVYIGSLDDNIYAFDAANGSQLWSAKTAAPIEWASPAISDGILYIGSLDQNFYAYALDGGRNGAYEGRRTAPPSFTSLHPNLRLKPESKGRNP